MQRIKNLLSRMVNLTTNSSDLNTDIKREKLKVVNNSDDFISALPPEVMEVILQKLNIVGFHCFSAVCKSWRSIAVTAKHHQHFSFRQLPWLMLSTNNSLRDDQQRFFSLMLSTNNSLQDDEQRFFSLDHGKIFKLNLPEVCHCRCCGSSWGWLILANRSGDNILFNPFSRRKIQLPSQTTLPVAQYIHTLGGVMEQWWKGPSFIRKAMLLSPPASDNDGNIVGDDCIVVAIYELAKLCFCRPGDQAWTGFGNEHLGVSFEDMILYNDQLYGVTDEYDLVLIELDPQPRGTKVTMPSPDGHDRHSHPDSEFIYLVESCGELLMVVRHCRYPTGNGSFPPCFTTAFKVFKFDSSGPRWVEVDNLGDQMLFVGTSSGISFSASLFSGFRGNCIYFTDDNFWNIVIIFEGPKACRDLGVFSLDDGSIKSFFPTGSHSSLCPPVWYMPSHL
ncbi:probable F-box protein At1g44080 [Cornus florida]|uniref:probable F-box protein At1g44080 n=1 Tax=Cornus florida TaxID=4283 RepID=UPI0028A26E1F|nr:probable F-box protein At1g44080 [Cornus florida]XP_059626766.1 probable F-box protein At1g44080 [Cornus florida]XP_059626767.1 probable F-box protein At1g44080 [Cornus florida]XP_059626768.1 probable F-box protein At1g44080 [Cornus florida]XP_059626769.1 probable F-box protein At1g44080 [Cornus florida]